jgi:hypothetical protein
MLLDSVKRYDTNGAVKLCCVEQIRKSNPKVLQRISMVPALILSPTGGSKEILFGKDVFDFLLLPNRGRLMQPSLSKKEESPQSITTSAPINVVQDGPDGFELTASAGNFTFIENEAEIPNALGHLWSSVNEDKPIGELAPTQAINSDQRSKKDLPTMESIMAQRDNDVSFMKPNNPPPGGRPL